MTEEVKVTVLCPDCGQPIEGLIEPLTFSLLDPFAEEHMSCSITRQLGALRIAVSVLHRHWSDS